VGKKGFLGSWLGNNKRIMSLPLSKKLEEFGQVGKFLPTSSRLQNVGEIQPTSQKITPTTVPSKVVSPFSIQRSTNTLFSTDKFSQSPDFIKPIGQAIGTAISPLTPIKGAIKGVSSIIDISKTISQDISKIKQGISYEPPPENLSLKQQIEWNQKQSEKSKDAQEAIKRSLGGMQLGLEAYAPTSLGVRGAEYIQKQRGLPSPILKPEEIELPEAVKIGINIGGAVLGFMTIGQATGKFMTSSKFLAPFIKQYPKLAKTLHFITTAGTVDQMKTPIDALVTERANIFFTQLPSYIGMGYGFAIPPSAQNIIPAALSAFTGQYFSSKLEGKSYEDAFKDL